MKDWTRWLWVAQLVRSCRERGVLGSEQEFRTVAHRCRECRATAVAKRDATPVPDRGHCRNEPIPGVGAVH